MKGSDGPLSNRVAGPLSKAGLYTAEGNMITNEPYGQSITRGMREINSRQPYEAVRPG